MPSARDRRACLAIWQERKFKKIGPLEQITNQGMRSQSAD